MRAASVLHVLGTTVERVVEIEKHSRKCPDFLKCTFWVKKRMTMTVTIQYMVVSAFEIGQLRLRGGR